MIWTPDYFRDKTLFVTGAASGIGRAAARLFAGEGSAVVCVDVDAEGNERTAQAIRSEGGRAEAVTANVARRADVEAAVRRGLEAFGRIDFQFNCAGSAMRRCKFLEIDDELWDATYDLNVKGVLYGMQAVLPHMLERGRGVIVNVASMSHRRGGPGASVHYASAKGAVVTLTLGVAREFADRGIRCLSVSPGPIDTAFQAASQTSPELARRFLADIPMGRLGRPEEIAALVAFMCSDACEFMTADTVYVNGGGGWR